MLINSPPARCEGCGRRTRGPHGSGPAPGDPRAWFLLDGADTVLSLEDGREATRRGRGWACRRCGHTVPLSREFPTTHRTSE